MKSLPVILIVAFTWVTASIIGTGPSDAFRSPTKSGRHGVGPDEKSRAVVEESEETEKGFNRRGRSGESFGESRGRGIRTSKAAEIKEQIDEADKLVRHSSSSHEFDLADSMLQKALKNADANDMPALSARAAVILGMIHLWRSDFSTAIKYNQRAIQYAQKSSNCKAEASAKKNIGLAYVALADYSAAHMMMTEALQISERCGIPQIEAYILKDLARVYRFQNKYSKAIESLEKASRINSAAGNQELEGFIAKELGSVYSSMGQYGRAMNYLSESARIGEKINHPVMKQESLLEISEVFSTRGRYREAAEYANKTLNLAETTGSPRLQSSALLSLGKVYCEWGRYGEALNYFKRALALSEKTAIAHQQARIMMDMGTLFSYQGLHTQSIDALGQALDLYKKIENAKGLASVINRLGLVYKNMGQNEKALNNFEQAEKIYKDLGFPRSVATINLADIYLDMGELEKATTLINDLRFLPLQGRLGLLKNDYTEALKYYEALRVTAEHNRNSSELFSAYTGLGLALESLGDLPQAEKYFSKAVEHTEELRDRLGPTERENFFDVRIYGFLRTTPYEGLARVLVKMNRPVEAFKESEYSRARVFAESLSKRLYRPSMDVPPEIRETDSSLIDELAALSSNLQKAHELGEKDVIAALEPQVHEAKEKLREFINMVRLKYPLFSATRHPQPVDIASTALRPGEWVIAFHVTDPGIITYVTHGKELVSGMFKAVSREELGSLVYKFRESIEIQDGQDFINKLKSFDFVTGKKLSDILIADILPTIPKDQHIILIPDDSLGILPFEMLPTSDQGRIVTDHLVPHAAGADFFGDRNLISYYQSTTALTLSRNYGINQGSLSKVLVFADPVFQVTDPRYADYVKSHPDQDGALSRNQIQESGAGIDYAGINIPRLVLTARLAEKLSHAYGKETESYTGLEASKKRFMEKAGQTDAKFEMVVFATHGYFGKDLPGVMEPVLILTLVPPGSDGLLSMSEVMGLKMNSKLVALTACQTGLGRKISGEGTMGMGRAFQYAGSKCVLMSLWSVEQRSSVNLMELFFKHIQEGHSLLSALHMSRLQIRKQGYDHPFFWAPFILVGEAS